MLTAREVELKALDKALDSLDGHSFEYAGLGGAYIYLEQYRALLDQKYDEIQELLEQLEGE